MLVGVMIAIRLSEELLKEFKACPRLPSHPRVPSKSQKDTGVWAVERRFADDVILHTAINAELLARNACASTCEFFSNGGDNEYLAVKVHKCEHLLM